MRVSTSVANTKKEHFPASSLARECFFCIYSAPARHEQDAKRLRMATYVETRGKEAPARHEQDALRLRMATLTPSEAIA